MTIAKPITTSPLRPSAKAEARVTNPLPAPTTCPNCFGPVSLVNNAEIYGKSYGDWPWAYRCDDRQCNTHIGLHPYTAIPLGTMANAELRAARMAVKVVFNPIWQGGVGSYGIARSKAYAWLAAQMGIPVARCHIGWFDVHMCNRAVQVCKTHPIYHTEKETT